MTPVNALGSLLDRDLPSEYRREATEHIAAKVQTTAVTTESAVIFRVRQEWLALSTLLFQSVAPMSPIHPLPHRRGGALLGVTHVQGELLLGVSLAALLGIVNTPAHERDSASTDRLMIVKGEGGPLAFPVQQIHGVHRYRAEELREVPATLAHANSRFTIGMLAWNERWVARLDDGLLLHAVSRALT